jgi:nicotinic acid phosphoribosyltransferase
MANQFVGARCDAGDPDAWAEAMKKHYAALGIQAIAINPVTIPMPSDDELYEYSRVVKVIDGIDVSANMQILRKISGMDGKITLK